MNAICLSVIRVALTLLSLWWRPGPVPLQHTMSFMWLSSLWISSSTASHSKPATHNFTFWCGFFRPRNIWWCEVIFISSPKCYHSCPITNHHFRRSCLSSTCLKDAQTRNARYAAFYRACWWQRENCEVWIFTKKKRKNCVLENSVQ